LWQKNNLGTWLAKAIQWDNGMKENKFSVINLNGSVNLVSIDAI